MKLRISRRVIMRAALGLALGVVAFVAAVRWVPFPDGKLQRFPAAMVLTDRDGTPLRVKLGIEGLDCRPWYEPAEDDWIAKAIVAAEDKRFWSHGGVDPAALLRAVGQNVSHGRRISGASTLSTQVIRLIEPGPRTLPRKVYEAFRALQLERRLTKREILGQYLNRAPFGGNMQGIEAAARRYFGKDPHTLSLGEAALLAGLPQSPSRLRPDRHYERSRERQRYVLDRMLGCGFIDAAQFAAATAEQVAVRKPDYPFSAPHFCDYVTGGAGPAQRAAELVTTLDAGIQRVAEEAVRREANRLGPLGVSGLAAVVIEVRSGAVRALVGSPSYFEKAAAGQVNAALAPRSAGSTLKPFAYALGFERGLITPMTALPDVPSRAADTDTRNFDAEFRGVVNVRDALVLSLNLPAVDVQRRVGQPLLLSTLRQLGLRTLTRDAAAYGSGLVLGNAEVTLLDLANAYACLARGGEFQPCRLFEADAVAQPVRLLSPGACWLVADALSGPERAGDATGHGADVELPPLAWKTGTSSGFRDAWTIAFNPEYVIGIWCGNPDGRPSEQLVGRTAAAPLVWSIFRRLHPDNDGPPFEQPDDVARRAVCAASGCVPGANCPHSTEDWYLRGASTFRSCAVHPRPAGADGKVPEIWPADVAAFLAKRESARSVAKQETRPGLRILSPADGSVFRLMSGLDGVRQQLMLDAAAPGATNVQWFINDRPLTTSTPTQPLFWPLERGRHTIVCADAAGRADCVAITVE